MVPTGAGFADPARGAMLLVTELSLQSYARVMQDFSSERMQGMELVAREMIALPGGDGLLVVARQTENGVALRKWALLPHRGHDGNRGRDIARDGTRGLSGRGAARRVGSVTVRAKFSPEEMLAVLPTGSTTSADSACCARARTAPRY